MKRGRSSLAVFWARLRAAVGTGVISIAIGFADALPDHLILPVLGGAMLVGFGLIFWACYDSYEGDDEE